MEDYPFQLSTVCSKLLNDGIKVTKKTLKRFLRELGYSYKRARASITKQDRAIIKEAQKEIERFKSEVAKDDLLNLYYFDESSFSLNPNIPYGWSPKNQTISLEASRSKSLKVLGFLGLDNQLKAYTTTDTINSEFVIAIFDDFVEQLQENSTLVLGKLKKLQWTSIPKKLTLKDFNYQLNEFNKNPTIIVILDNAPIHTSHLFQDKIEEWKEKGLILYFLPTYSPELNRIEILWRFMKYHWIEIKDYASTQALEDYVHNVLATYGKNDGLEINFG